MTHAAMAMPYHLSCSCGQEPCLTWPRWYAAGLTTTCLQHGNCPNDPVCPPEKRSRRGEPFVLLQAPLLAYNHFVEALFVLNDCRAGLHGGGSAALISDTDSSEAGQSNLTHLKGSSPSARAKREAIYRSAAPPGFFLLMKSQCLYKLNIGMLEWCTVKIACF